MKRALKDGLEIDDDRRRIDVSAVHRFLSSEAYWAAARSRNTVEELVNGAARVVGLYDGAHQIGFARVVSDGLTMAYLADVYVVPKYRGRGLGLELVREAVERGPHARLWWLLATRDAHGLYSKLGFVPAAPHVMQRLRRSASSTRSPGDPEPR